MGKNLVGEVALERASGKMSALTMMSTKMTKMTKMTKIIIMTTMDASTTCMAMRLHSSNQQ